MISDLDVKISLKALVGFNNGCAAAEFQRNLNSGRVTIFFTGSVWCAFYLVNKGTSDIKGCTESHFIIISFCLVSWRSPLKA